MTLPRLAVTALLAAACTPALPASTARQPAPPPDAILEVRRDIVTVDGLQAGTLAAAPDDPALSALARGLGRDRGVGTGP